RCRRVPMKNSYLKLCSHRGFSSVKHDPAAFDATESRVPALQPVMTGTMGSGEEKRFASIPTPDGAMRVFVAVPQGRGPFPAVVIVQHIGGLSPTMQTAACGIARLGFLCVVPALYHRLGTIIVDPVSPDPDVVAIRAIAVRSLLQPQVLADLRATLDWL